MTADGPYPPQRGHAWRGDWKRRLTTLLADRGHDTVTSFLAMHPRRSLVDLADNVLDGGDVAAIQLQWTFLDEAHASGPTAVEQCARDLLVRYLHRYMPTGWNDADETADGMAYSSWSSAISRVASVDSLALWEALANQARPGWLPHDNDDPLLVAVFQAHWRPTSGPTA